MTEQALLYLWPSLVQTMGSTSMRLMTNLCRDEFSATAILLTYRLRWQVELYFKELKSYANLHAFSTRKKHIAEGLFWASLCVAFLKRYMAHACQRVKGVAISTRRVAMCAHVFLNPLMESLRSDFVGLGPVLSRAFEYLASNAPRSNLKREQKTGPLAIGLKPCQVPQFRGIAKLGVL